MIYEILQIKEVLFHYICRKLFCMAKNNYYIKIEYLCVIKFL